MRVRQMPLERSSFAVVLLLLLPFPSRGRNVHGAAAWLPSVATSGARSIAPPARPRHPRNPQRSGWATRPHPRQETVDEADGSRQERPGHGIPSDRRSFVRSLAALSAGAGAGLAPRSPAPAAAAVDLEAAAASDRSLDEDLAARLRAVPTFTLVDGGGVPFMVVGEDARVTGYFFTTYGEAARLLELARSTAARALQVQRREDPAAARGATNPWDRARVSTIPLDLAVAVVARSRAGALGGNNYFQVAPAAADVEDALAATNQTDLAEGKVPLFYYEDFTLRDDDANRTVSPLYFRASELRAAYAREHPPPEEPPPVRVTELFAVLGELASKSQDPELRALAFVPPAESAAKARQCRSKVPFVLGQRNIVL